MMQLPPEPTAPGRARAFLREGDRMVLAEKHPAEAAGLSAAFPGAEGRETDGPQAALIELPDNYDRYTLDTSANALVLRASSAPVPAWRLEERALPGFAARRAASG